MGEATGRAGSGEVLVAESDAWPRAAARLVATAIRRTLEEAESCSVALAGGSTPEPAYRRLAGRKGLDWTAVEVFFGDERAVPPDHPESNYAMARETLLDRVALRSGAVHRMEAERPDRSRAAAEYARALPASLDLLLLGVGEDGHTASLFPGSPALEERERRVVPAEAPGSPSERLTITPPVIEASRRIVVLAAGRRKAGPVERALAAGGSVEACPARLARPGTWMLDRGAAAGVSERAREVDGGGSA